MYLCRAMLKAQKLYISEINSDPGQLNKKICKISEVNSPTNFSVPVTTHDSGQDPHAIACGGHEGGEGGRERERAQHTQAHAHNAGRAPTRMQPTTEAAA